MKVSFKICALNIIIVTLVAFSVINVLGEDDVRCLQGVKNSLDNPEGELTTWNFASSSVGFICNFVGVSCWNDRENRIINLQLRDMKLSRQVLESLRYCQSLQNLDLSSNSLSGTIPAQICTWVPYLVTLDLSNNDLSGPIPPDLANCTYLNKLILSNNRLSGSIPFEFSGLGRLKQFSVENNDLAGTFPSFFTNLDSASFDGNKGLCGKPLSKCGGLSKKTLAIIIDAGVFGAAFSLLLGFGVWWWYHLRCSERKRKGGYGFGRDYDARIMDFGLAKMTCSDSNESSYVNGDLGEFGYVAPEYSSTMVASLKGDVYGFGVVLLELVTGQKPLDISNAEEGFKGSLVDWVNHLSSSGRSKDAVDKAICGKGHEEEIYQFLKIACNCVIARPKDRWSMCKAYQSLKTIASEHHVLSELDDEFPLIFGKQDYD
ncbi:hypothetical protein D5086_030511 [Populus alba]|uniref:Uncharacterized protein n=1 Tax=Populus alba TaxID=43335 RepID=A0ACC4ANX4_POPAL